MKATWRAVALAVLVSFTAAGTIQAQPTTKPGDFPARPLRFVIGLSAGGATDIIGRLVAKYVAEDLGQSVVVDNRAGAAGSIAGDIVAKSIPDGYTMLMVSSSFAINPSLYQLPFDSIRDFAPVAQIAQAPFLLVVNTGVPARSVEELITLAKAHPHMQRYSSGGTGGSGHLAGVLFGRMANVEVDHVPYRGGSPALIAVMSGEVQFTFSAIVAGLRQWRAGKVRALGVTSAKRSRAAPDVPTIAEAGVPGYQVLTWYGVLAPVKTRREVVDRVNAAVRKAVSLPEVSEKLLADGAEPVSDTPAAFGRLVESEVSRFRKLTADAGLKAAKETPR